MKQKSNSKEKTEKIRHSLSHILAYAVKELYPNTKFGIGPAIENGFYYDFDLPETISITDLEKIEKKMKEIIKKDIKFEKEIISKDKARKIFKDQSYKLELIDEIEDKKVSIYKSGYFIDLCKGPHIRSSKEIDINAFKLSKIAGAYWKGTEKNKMLTRIYGIAFGSKKELDAYLKQQKEIESRDHRILAEKLDLFHIDENIGPGLILWNPKGAILRRIIENYVLEEYFKNNYLPVLTPHIAKKTLWEISGHLSFYKENMFPPIHMKELNEEGEKDDYQIKPMNCPFHIAIYKNRIRSYKDLPLKYTEMGTVYRYERSGTLHGLTRVRGLTQDDAHIFCTIEQLEKELFEILKLALKILKSFGFKEFKFYLSTKPEKYVGTDEIWERAEKALIYALTKLKLKYEIDKGGGAFYGPKIDLKIKDAIGREWQCTTIQLDFNLPERFEMSYIDKKGKKQTPIMIHRALLGSLERFIGVLIEYYAGDFPLWISPLQTLVIPVGSKHRKYAKEINKKLRENNIRSEANIENETVSKKIREGEIQKIPYILVVGDKEMKNNSVRIRQRKKGDIGEMKLSKFLEKIKKEIDKKL
ncbi:MAG TPA: threonine--tRNA ligase [Candidatus Pacearchaeota archaeon]|nr:threonine--tRNA ligase [Candidatus Pacearchaeota archaeon]HOL90581.1 threonine--tRNA ligase [Candidatus Pacearchaeota archaeon]